MSIAKIVDELVHTRLIEGYAYPTHIELDIRSYNKLLAEVEPYLVIKELSIDPHTYFRGMCVIRVLTDGTHIKVYTKVSSAGIETERLDQIDHYS